MLRNVTNKVKFASAIPTFFDRCFESERVRKLRQPERSQIPFSCFDELFLPKCVKCVISNFKQYLHELFSVLFLEYVFISRPFPLLQTTNQKNLGGLI